METIQKGNFNALKLFANVWTKLFSVIRQHSSKSLNFAKQRNLRRKRIGEG